MAITMEQFNYIESFYKKPDLFHYDENSVPFKLFTVMRKGMDTFETNNARKYDVAVEHLFLEYSVPQTWSETAFYFLYIHKFRVQYDTFERRIGSLWWTINLPRGLYDDLAAFLGVALKTAIFQLYQEWSCDELVYQWGSVSGTMWLAKWAAEKDTSFTASSCTEHMAFIRDWMQVFSPFCTQPFFLFLKNI